MRYDLLLAAILIAISSIFMFWVLFALTRKGLLLGFKLLGLMALATSIFLIGYAAHILTGRENIQLVMNHIQYLGIPWIIMIWYFLSIQQKTRSRDLPFKKYGLFAIIPGMTLILNYLYPWRSGIDPQWFQSLFFSGHVVSTYPNIAPTFTTILYDKAWFYYIFMAYNVVLTVLAGINYLQIAKTTTSANRKRMITLSVISISAALAIVYSFVNPKTAVIDFAPFAASLFIVFSFIALYKYEFFDVIPIAYRQVFHNANHPLVVLDSDNMVISANQCARELFGESIDFHSMITLKDICKMKPGGMAEIEKNSYFDIEVPVNGDKRYFRIELQPLLSKTKKLKGRILVFRDVTELKLEMNRMEMMATYDDLTKILNRRVFYLRASNLFDEAVLEKANFAVMMFDLDDFKNVNDIYGHLAGDFVLAEMAQLITGTISPNDIFARYGGEEFVIYFSGRSPVEISHLAETIRHTLEAHLFVYEKHKIRITASFGIAGSDGTVSKSFEGYLKESDIALYQAKNAGKNQVVVIP